MIIIIAQVIIVLLLIAGVWLISNLKVREIRPEAKKLAKSIIDDYNKKKRNKHISMKKQVDALTSIKKKNFLVESFNEARVILTAQRRGDRIGTIYVISGICGAAGLVIALLSQNLLLIPTFTIGFTLIPVWIIKLSRASIRKSLNDELEVALSGITTSYMRNDSIIAAVEENLHILNNPIKPVFVKFINEFKFVDSNVVTGVRKMKQAINHEIFSEWCDALIQCQNDRSLKTTLFPIINKFSDIKSVQAELDTMMMAPFREYMTMVVVLLLIFPILYIVNREMFDILTTTDAGKVILAVISVIVFLGLNKAVNLSEPIEYRR